MSEAIRRAQERGAKITPVPVPEPPAQKIELVGLEESVEKQGELVTEIMNRFDSLAAKLGEFDPEVKVDVQVELESLKEFIAEKLKPCSYELNFERDERGRIMTGMRLDPVEQTS